MALPFKTVLIIDEMPMIAAGFHETLKSLQPAVKVEHVTNAFTALSARTYEDRSFDLVVLGSDEEHSPGSLLLPAAELRERFSGVRILIYTDKYDPAIIEAIGQGTIDACVHKNEEILEIHNAWRHLQQDQTYLSPMLHTLYAQYRLNR